MGDQLIEPSFYFPEGNVPVFQPTEDQFKDFSNFIKRVLPYGKESGIIKVIPPDGWKGRSLRLDSKLSSLKIKKPIKQTFFGSSGVYQQTNIENRKDFSVEQFEALSSSRDYRPPKISKGIQKQSEETAGASTEVLDTPATPPKSSPSFSPSLGGDLVSSPVPGDGTTSPSPQVPRLESNCYQLLLSTADFKEIERHYWRNVSFVPPYYGADLPGSLFEESVEQWNLNNLGDLLQSVGKVLPGVNTPYLYFGMWRATFAWHVEDMDLFSINYIHRGAPKQWYAIPPAHKERFEGVMKGLFSQSHKTCSEFLRHKTHLVSPKVLARHNIPVNKVVQYEGDFVITFPHGYHAGYNIDFNIAESVNFATDYWIDIGSKAKVCDCLDDSVTIDMRIFDKGSSAEKSKEVGIEKTILKPKNVNITRKRVARFSSTNYITVPPPVKKRTSRVSLLGLQPKGKVYFEQEPGVSTTGPKCIICNKQGGDILSSRTGMKYGHKLCAQYSPGVFITSTDDFKNEVLDGLDNVVLNQSSRRCYCCRKVGGATVSCAAPDCDRVFHVVCTKPCKLIRPCTKELPCIAFCLIHDSDSCDLQPKEALLSDFGLTF